MTGEAQPEQGGANGWHAGGGQEKSTPETLAAWGLPQTIRSIALGSDGVGRVELKILLCACFARELGAREAGSPWPQHPSREPGTPTN